MSQTENKIKEEFLKEIEQIVNNEPEESIHKDVENGVERKYIVTSTDNVDEIEYYLPEIDESVKTDYNGEIVMYIELSVDMNYKIALFYKEDKDKEEIKNRLKNGRELRNFGEAIVIDKFWSVYPQTHPFINREDRNIRTLKWILNNFKGEFY